MEVKVKVGAVSYLNTKPLLYGIENSSLINDIELVTDYPSAIAGMLVRNSIDVGLIPVAAIPLIEHPQIISDYCIGAEGPVASVCLFSQVPLEEIKTVVLDYQSRTSVALAQLLLQRFWKAEVQYLPAEPGFEHAIVGTTAAVVIGDRALMLRNSVSYCYDLAEAWQQWTGLPFVFAAWVANKTLPQSFISAFNSANAIGLDQIETVIQQNPCSYYDLKKYFTQNVSYLLTDEKKKGLQLFLKYIAEKETSAVTEVNEIPNLALK